MAIPARGLYFTNLHGCLRPPKCQPCLFPRLHDRRWLMCRSLAGPVVSTRRTPSQCFHSACSDRHYLNLGRAWTPLMMVLKRSHYCSTQRDHKREVCLVFPTSILVIFVSFCVWIVMSHSMRFTHLGTVYSLWAITIFIHILIFWCVYSSSKCSTGVPEKNKNCPSGKTCAAVEQRGHKVQVHLIYKQCSCSILDLFSWYLECRLSAVTLTPGV